MTLKKREDVSKEDCWNVEALYPSLEAWSKNFNEAFSQKTKVKWPDLEAYKGRLHESPEILKSALDLSMKIGRELTKLYTYAHLKHDEDITNDGHKVIYNQITSLLHDFAQESAWFEPELLALSPDQIEQVMASPAIMDYRFHIEKIVRIKKHLLSHEKEELLALAGKAMQTPNKAFCAINDADFKFEPAIDSSGKPRPLSHGTFGLYVRDQDRTLRENAFKNVHNKYLDYENTMTELLNGEVQTHLFNARARHYNSCLDAALFPKNIDASVYRALIEAVDKNIASLHRYMDLREEVLGIGQLHLYDMYVPLTKDVDIRLSYQEAEDLVIESAAPLGAEYQNTLRTGLKAHGWVDRYENQNKRSGAYSSGCYDSMPYILMNYKNVIRDVFTLAHEAGHSMHSLLSHQNQPFHYGDYPIFLAEVASTFNEELLMQLLLKRFTSKEEQIFLINQKIEDIRATLFRQTMFAKFELLIHEMAEKNIPLTPKGLKDEYLKLNSVYFGSNVAIDPAAAIEWARIPHFYYNFYVFQYATGISAALALAERVTQGGKVEREDYLSFLKSGSSRYPIEILKSAGVDMRSPQPVSSAIKKFDGLVSDLQQLLVPQKPIPNKKPDSILK